MNKILLTIVAFFSVLTASAEGKSLFVTFSDGTKAEYALSTLPQISMANDKLTVETTATTAEFDLYMVKTFTFGEASGIRAIETKGYSINGDAIVFDGEATQTRIFSLDGKTLSVAPIISNGQTIVPLSSLKSGVYIISIDGKSVKISRR